MRTTITIDDELLKTAKEYTGIQQNSALVQRAVEELVQREAGRRLALLSDTMAEHEYIPRRHFNAE